MQRSPAKLPIAAKGLVTVGVSLLGESSDRLVTPLVSKRSRRARAESSATWTRGEDLRYSESLYDKERRIHFPL